MNKQFEYHISSIQRKLTQQISLTRWLSIFIILISIVFIIIFRPYYYCFLLTIFIGLLILGLSFLFSKTKHDLTHLLDIYENNQEEVRDYLESVLKNAQLYQNNYLIRRYYRRYLKNYMDAYHALKK